MTTSYAFILGEPQRARRGRGGICGLAMSISDQNLAIEAADEKTHAALLALVRNQTPAA
jgi:hypothetical protein